MGQRALLPLFACLTAALVAEPPGTFAIRNARIVPVSKPVIAKGTVVIKDGLIQDVGPEVQPPAGAWVIEGEGLTVYPGLIDALSTVGIPDEHLAPADTRRQGPRPTFAGTPSVPSAPPGRARGPEDRPNTFSWLKAADVLNVTDARIKALRDAGFTSAFTFPTRGQIAGQGALINLAGERPGEMVVAPSVAQYMTLRTGGFTSFPGSLMGAIAYIRQLWWDMDHYAQEKRRYQGGVTGRRRPAYDRALEGLLESTAFLLPADNRVQLERMINFAKELGMKPILYGGTEAWRENTAKFVADSSLALLLSLKFPEAPRGEDPDELTQLRVLENREYGASSAVALAKARARWAFFSGGLDRPADLMRNVRKAIAAGLTAEQALRAMTLSPAEIYGFADRVGSIDKGKIANLVVTKGNLFDEKTKVQFVMIDGKKYEPAPEPARPSASDAPPTGGAQ